MTSKRIPAQKMQLAVVLMVFPWVFVYVLSGLMQGFLFYGLTLPAGNGIASVVFSKTESSANGASSSGTLQGETRMGISEIRDFAGNTVMPGQPIVLVCPGDTVTFYLDMSPNGHVGRFFTDRSRNKKQFS